MSQIAPGANKRSKLERPITDEISCVELLAGGCKRPKGGNSAT